MKNDKSEFFNRMQQILGKDYNKFEQALTLPSQKALLVNQNKIAVERFKGLIDFKIEQIKYENAGFYIGDEKRGRHPLHHAGAFYLQEPSAMFTVNAYNFKGDEKVLDMCSAPGGKAIQIANRIPNGVLVSNEYVQARSQILFSNIERMGLKNVIITNEKPENLAKAYANSFDVCLVDAPCSGEGMFRKGEDVITHWNANLPIMCAERQKEILISADKCLKQNGTLIYSTCTYSIEENEEVVNWLIDELGYSLQNINGDFTRGINMPQAVRLYPHQVRGEGQFVAVLKKTKENNCLTASTLKLSQDRVAEDFVTNTTGEHLSIYRYMDRTYFIPNINLVKKNINYVSLGVVVGEYFKSRFEPCHNLFTAFGNMFKLKLDYNFDCLDIKRYLRGETLDVELPDGYGVILASGCAVGGFKISSGKFKNLYPKGLRNF